MASPCKARPLRPARRATWPAGHPFARRRSSVRRPAPGARSLCNPPLPLPLPQPGTIFDSPAGAGRAPQARSVRPGGPGLIDQRSRSPRSGPGIGGTRPGLCLVAVSAADVRVAVSATALEGRGRGLHLADRPWRPRPSLARAGLGPNLMARGPRPGFTRGGACQWPGRLGPTGCKCEAEPESAACPAAAAPIGRSESSRIRVNMMAAVGPARGPGRASPQPGGSVTLRCSAAPYLAAWRSPGR